MQEVVLITPRESRFVEGFTRSESLGVQYISAFLRIRGYSVEVINCTVQSLDAETVARYVINLHPKVVGVSVLYAPHLPHALQIIKLLHNLDPRIHINLGGHIPTFAYEELLNGFPQVTSITRGEGEITFYQLVKLIIEDKEWRGIQGIAYRKNNHVVCNPSRPLIPDLNALPFPSRDTLERILDSNRRPLTAYMITSRGCYGNCSFCSVRPFYDLSEGKKWRARDPQNVVDEIEYLVEKYGVRAFHFHDDNFIGPGRVGKRRAVNIGVEILKRDLKIVFAMECRTNDVEYSLFALLRQAGLRRVFIGIESGVQNVLDRFHKHTTIEQNKNAINVLNKLGLEWDTGFILFDPDTTFAEIKENLRFIRENRLYRYSAAPLLLTELVPAPGTIIEKKLGAAGRLRKVSEETEIAGNIIPGLQLGGKVWTSVFQSYELEDSKAEAAREVLNYVHGDLAQRHDVIWPLEDQWTDHFFLLRKITGFSELTLKNIPIFKAWIGDDLKRWTQNIGTLVYMILEEVIGVLDAKQSLNVDDVELLRKKTTSMADEYDFRVFGLSLKEKVEEIEKVLNERTLEFTFEGRSFSLDILERRLIVNSMKNDRKNDKK